jgi:hypothetical protein
MNLSRDSALALQRHYVGALSQAATTWLESLPANRVAFAGGAIRTDGESCVLDFGVVDTPNGERRAVRIFQPGPQPISIRVSEVPAWIVADWSDETNASILIVRITADHEGERCDDLTLRVRDERGVRFEKLRLRVVGRPRQPFADITFNGDAAAEPFAFDGDRGVYTIAVANRNSVPLVVTFSDLPEWLELTVDGCSRRGPIAGAFFERKASFTAYLRPRLLGRHEGSVRMQTNDRRPELRDVLLRFSADIAPLRPHIRAVSPPPLAAGSKTVTAHARLENWGRSPARISANVTTQCATVPALIRIPAARDGRPGTADLPIRVTASRLAPGTQTLIVALQIEDGDPAQCGVPVQVIVAARRSRQRPFIRPETIAAFLALVILAIVLLGAMREWS